MSKIFPKLKHFGLIAMIIVFSVSLSKAQDKSSLKSKLKSLKGKVDKIVIYAGDQKVSLDKNEAKELLELNKNKKFNKEIKVLKRLSKDSDGSVFVFDTDGKDSDLDIIIEAEDGEKKLKVIRIEDGKKVIEEFIGEDLKKKLKELKEDGEFGEIHIEKNISKNHWIGDKVKSSTFNIELKDDKFEEVKIEIEDGETVVTYKEKGGQTKTLKGDEAKEFIKQFHSKGNIDIDVDTDVDSIEKIFIRDADGKHKKMFIISEDEVCDSTINGKKMLKVKVKKIKK